VIFSDAWLLINADPVHHRLQRTRQGISGESINENPDKSL
jgi:hypothetical protein